MLRSLPRHYFDSAKDGELQGSSVANILRANGKFRVVTAALLMPHGSLISMALGGISAVRVVNVPDVMTLRCGIGGRFRSESARKNNVEGNCILVPPDSPFMALGHNESSVLLSLHHRVLARTLGTDCIPKVELQSLDKKGGEVIRANVFSAAQAVENFAEDLRSKFLRNFQNAISSSVAALLREISPEFRAPDPMIGRRKVADLREWAALDHEEPLTVGDLAARCGLGLRALQKNFLRHFDTTPQIYLRNLRLDKCRKLIASGQHTVTEAALHAGFTHLGHFSAAYREKFGEPPSATLRQTRNKM